MRHSQKFSTLAALQFVSPTQKREGTRVNGGFGKVDTLHNLIFTVSTHHFFRFTESKPQQKFQDLATSISQSCDDFACGTGSLRLLPAQVACLRFMEGKDTEMHVTHVAERHSTHASFSDEDENVVPEGSRLLASSSKSDGHGAHEVSGEVREDNGKDSHGGSKSEPVIFGYKLKGAFFCMCGLLLERILCSKSKYFSWLQQSDPQPSGNSSTSGQAQVSAEL